MTGEPRLSWTLGEVRFTPADATNVCPATGADTALASWAGNFDTETVGVLDVAICEVDGTEPVASDPEVPVDYDVDTGLGYFAYSVEALGAGGILRRRNR